MDQSVIEAVSDTASGVVTRNIPTVIVGAKFAYGLTLDQWVSVATLAWIGLQASFYLYDRLVRRRKGRK